MDTTTLASILTAIIGILAVFGGVYWKKFNTLVKEGAEAAIAMATLLGDFKTAVKPDEDGKIRITEEEAEILVRAYEMFLKEWKDVLVVFKHGVGKSVLPSLVRTRKGIKIEEPTGYAEVLKEYKPLLEKMLTESSKKPRKKKAEVSK